MAGNNRMFVLIALFLVGLLVLGLVAIGGVVAFGSINRAQKAARPTATSTLPAVAKAPTPTYTLIPTATPAPTNTLLPTATNTPVVLPTVAGQSGGDTGAQAEVSGQATPVSAATPTSVAGATPVSQESTPDTGIGGLEAVLIAAGLVGVLFVTRRLRSHA